MNLSEIRSGWSLVGAFRAMVTAVKGKQAQVAANAITTFAGLLIAFGDNELHLHLMSYVHVAAQMFAMSDAQFLGGVGVAGYGLANWILTVITTDKIGITGRAKPAGNVAITSENNVAAPVPAAPSDPATSTVAGVQVEPAPSGVQPASDALTRQDQQSLRAGG